MSAILVLGGLAFVAFVAVLALAVWPRKPPVVGQLLPFPDPKKRKRFESWLN